MLTPDAPVPDRRRHELVIRTALTAAAVLALAGAFVVVFAASGWLSWLAGLLVACAVGCVLWASIRLIDALWLRFEAGGALEERERR